jgi:hypothetical protein
MDKNTISYVMKAFGLPKATATDEPAKLTGGMPAFFKSAASIRLYKYGDLKFLLIEPKKKMSFDQLKALYKQVADNNNLPVLMLIDDIVPKQRGLFMRERIPHIHTDHSVYAPQLGRVFKGKSVDPKRVIVQTSLSPGALRMATFYLLYTSEIKNGWTLEEWISAIKRKNPFGTVSVPTLSRAVQQLMAVGIISSRVVGAKHSIVFADRDYIWLRLCNLQLPLINRVEEISDFDLLADSFVLAGETALAQYSDLIEPKITVVAIGALAYRWIKDGAIKKTNVKTKHFSAARVQIWSELPTSFADDGYVNRIYLALSIKEELSDLRIQEALTDSLRPLQIDASLLWSAK